jgi:hypothetical protein
LKGWSYEVEFWPPGVGSRDSFALFKSTSKCLTICISEKTKLKLKTKTTIWKRDKTRLNRMEMEKICYRTKNVKRQSQNCVDHKDR